MPLLRQSIFHRTVIDGFQNTHIEGYGIGRISPTFQISLVFRKQIRIKLVKQDITVIHKTAETSESGCISFRGTYLPQAFQSRYLLSDVSIKRQFLPVVMKAHDYIIRNKCAGLG